MKVQIKNDNGELILDVTAIPESNSLETQLALEKDTDGGLLFRARQLGVIGPPPRPFPSVSRAAAAETAPSLTPHSPRGTPSRVYKCS